MPSDTYFNAGALENLRELPRPQALLVTDARHRGARRRPTRCARHLDGAGVHVFAEVEPEPREAQIRAGVEVLDELRARPPDRASAAAR